MIAKWATKKPKLLVKTSMNVNSNLICATPTQHASIHLEVITANVSKVTLALVENAKMLTNVAIQI